MLNKFKTMVDNATAVIPTLSNDYNAVCEYLQIDSNNGYAHQWVTDKLKTNIDKLLDPTGLLDSISSQLLTDLRDGLIYESVLMDCDNSIYLTVLEIVRRGHKGLQPFTAESNWHRAIVFAKDYDFFSPDVYTVHNHKLKDKYHKTHEVAQAAKELKKLGVTVELDDYTLKIIAGLEVIAESIEERIKQLGAISFIKSLFTFMVNKGYYLKPLKRYVVVNPVTLLPSQARSILPFGFLLNLAIKHLDVLPAQLSNKQQQDKYAEALERACLLATVMGIRNYGTFDLVFQSTEKLPDFISRLALFDSTYSIVSNDPSECLEYLTHLFDWLTEAAFEAKYNFSVTQFKKVSESIITHAPLHGPYLFTLQNVRNWNHGIPEERIQSILDYLSHDSEVVNKDYKYLNDYQALDFGFKPLVKIKAHSYILADRSWCAQAFFEAFSACCREVDRGCDNKIGLAAERYLTDKCLNAGINLIQGDYARPDGKKTGEGEADGIIESSKMIITLESKKKSLTRRARGGSDVALLIDLAGSLLAAHVQSGKTEIKLRRNGHLYLVNNGNINRIDLNDREIDRIAMSVLDFGSFQDRMIINGLLTNLANASYHVIDKANTEDVEKFAKLEAKRSEWEQQSKDLKLLDPDFDKAPFFNCWFLSLSQLLMIIRYCKTNEDFASALKATRNITFGVGNFYYDFYHFYILKLR